MKKIVIMLCILLLTGCFNESNVEVNPIDPSIWGYDFNSNQLSGAFSAMRTVTESDKGVYFEIKIPNNDSQTSILGYVDKITGKFSIVDSSGSASCSVDSPTMCSSNYDKGYKYLNFYNSQLYFVDTTFDSKSGASSMVLVQMDLDGTNRKNVATLSDRVSDSHSFSILFHRGMIYYSFGSSKLSRIDMSTWRNDEIVSEGISGSINLINAIDLQVYFSATSYSTLNLKETDVLLSVSMDQENIELVESKLQLYQFKDNHYVFYNEVDDTMNYYDSDSGYKSFLKQGTGSVIFQDDFFIIKDYSFGQNPQDLFLYHHDGSLLSTYAQNDDSRIGGFAQVITEGYYYTYIYYEDRTEFVRIPIIDFNMKEPELIASWLGSIHGG